MRRSRVILVDEEDTAVGVADKLPAHQLGQLHRAFSVFIFGRPGLLLQQRSGEKYHSGLLWSNACCGHPEPDEPILQAGRRRLGEEMRLECDLSETISLIYRLELPGRLVEHELNHLMVGWTEESPSPDPSEVADWRWIAPRALDEELAGRQEEFTAWFPLVWRSLAEWSATADLTRPGSGLNRALRAAAGA